MDDFYEGQDLGHVEPEGGDLDEKEVSCDHTEFKCPRERKCIPQSAVCNEFRDCEDGADEANCAALGHDVGGQHTDPGHEDDFIDQSGNGLDDSEFKI